VGCILREVVPIHEIDLRHPRKCHFLIILISKLHKRYKFPPKYDNEDLKENSINSYTITKMITALASWRTRVKK
jgi:hypothetical protein